MPLNRLIITGANGAGKSHAAGKLGKKRPDLDVICYDALRLTENWAKKPQGEIDQAIATLVNQDSWILEGGPSLLRHALPRCQGVIWLDPPAGLRALRLATRPWKNFGQVRPELPGGNVDWPLQQYAFALRSLRKGRRMRLAIQQSLRETPPQHLWHCRSDRQVDAALCAVT